jgi:hypothetical protein
MRRALPLLALLVALGLPAPASATPTITFTCTPAPSSCNGWYRAPVTIHWDWIPSNAQVIAGCDSNDPVDFDTTGAVRSCKVSDGVAVTIDVPLKVDQTPPIVTGASASRQPDHDGWYRSPVQVTFSGSDATSGLLGCSSTTYDGPNAAAVDLLGRCQDVAGNVSVATPFGLRYDSAPPTVTDVRASASDERVRLRWKIPDGTAVDVSRVGPGGHRRHLRSAGPRGSLVDRDVRNGRRYRYDLTATDPAGNVATRTLTAVPGPRLLAPTTGARVTGAPLLRWTTVRGADYYNVQLYRGRRKLLSAWPGRPRLQLDRRWRFGGQSRRLVHGKRYRWFVWPGHGPRADSAYGRLIGTSTFTVGAS